jgi:hypothetical protein
MVRAGEDAPAASRAVAAGLLWNMRVLAGWLQARGVDVLRVLASWFEIANIEEHLLALTGRQAPPPYRLGSLATAWPRVAGCGSTEALRDALAASPWRYPGGTTPREFQLGLRLAWADRVAARVPGARPWAQGGAALLVARERFVRGQPMPDALRAACVRVLGPGLATVPGSLSELRASLGAGARWALDGVTDATELWRAEAAWWRRVHADSAVLVARAGFGAEPVVGTVGLLAHDAWLVRGALAGAGRDGDAVTAFVELARRGTEPGDAVA